MIVFSNLFYKWWTWGQSTCTGSFCSSQHCGWLNIDRSMRYKLTCGIRSCQSKPVLTKDVRHRNRGIRAHLYRHDKLFAIDVRSSDDNYASLVFRWPCIIRILGIQVNSGVRGKTIKEEERHLGEWNMTIIKYLIGPHKGGEGDADGHQMTKWSNGDAPNRRIWKNHPS